MYDINPFVIAVIIAVVAVGVALMYTRRGPLEEIEAQEDKNTSRIFTDCWDLRECLEAAMAAMLLEHRLSKFTADDVYNCMLNNGLVRAAHAEYLAHIEKVLEHGVFLKLIEFNDEDADCRLYRLTYHGQALMVNSKVLMAHNLLPHTTHLEFMMESFREFSTEFTYDFEDVYLWDNTMYVCQRAITKGSNHDELFGQGVTNKFTMSNWYSQYCV